MWCRSIPENRTELRGVAGFQLCRDNCLLSHPALLVFLQLLNTAWHFTQLCPSCIAHWQLKMWSAFVLIAQWCVTCWRLHQGVNVQPHFICYKCLLFSSCCFGRGVDLQYLQAYTELFSTSAAQCPLDVGVVASVTTRWKKECWPRESSTPPSGGL